MPRYHIDVGVGATAVRDDEGAEYADLGEARREALLSLGDVSRAKVAGGDPCDFVVTVRDQGDKCVFQATLCLEISDS